MTRYTKFKKTFNPTAVSSETPASSERNNSRVEKPKSSARNFNNDNSRYNNNEAFSSGKTCLKCRKTGHAMKDCPESKTLQVYCYNCGEEDHSTKQCPLPFSNYAHAQCFLCDTKGHLASACPKNDRGVYPNGGCCHYCGSVKHMARNCRPTQSAQNGNEIIISASMTAGANPEDDDVHEALRKMQESRQEHLTEKKNADQNGGNKKTKKKVVTF